MNEKHPEDVLCEYINRVKVEGRIPPEDKIHRLVEIACAEILRNK